MIGLKLRKAWLVNGIIYNSEVLHTVSKSDIGHFFKQLFSTHAKSPKDHLYLEIGLLKYPIYGREIGFII